MDNLKTVELRNPGAAQMRHIIEQSIYALADIDGMSAADVKKKFLEGCESTERKLFKLAACFAATLQAAS